MEPDEYEDVTQEDEDSIIRRLDFDSKLRALPEPQRRAVFKKMHGYVLTSTERKDLHRAAKVLKIGS